MPSTYESISGDKSYVQRKICLISSITAAIAFLVIGILIGYASFRPKNNDKFDYNDDIAQKNLINLFDTDTVSTFLRGLTNGPQLAGTDDDKLMAENVSAIWKEQGLDDVKIKSYNVLLSYPDRENPNIISLLNQDGTVSFSSNPKEKPLKSPEENDPNIIPPFNSYSPGTNGPLKGDLIYVNYAREEDFKALQKFGQNATGKIVIARYAKIFRGNKAFFAERFGAIGLILYPDPKDYIAEGKENETYPNGVYMPESGAPRGTVFIKEGDPLTPDYPSLPYSYQISEQDASLPTIPVHPINYADARKILSQMDGPEVPADWKGGFDFPYKFGPLLNQKIQMTVNNKNEKRDIHNVIGLIKGSVEPDRYVIIGNHRDSWALGGADPSSGTAAMLEVSRVFGHLMKQGWRPRRSILFCSWGAEEYALIGSMEWVEENLKVLSSQAVAYLNVDTAVQGNFSFHGRGVPLLYNVLWDSAKKVPNPNPDEVNKGLATLYDSWSSHVDKTEEGFPMVDRIGSGSDFFGFIHFTGIPSIDLRFECDKNDGITCYPLYHTLYETFYLQDQLQDRGFHYHKALSQMWAEVARNLADSEILSFSIEQYPKVLKKSFDVLKSTLGQKINEYGAGKYLDFIEGAIKNFSAAVDKFKELLNGVDKKNPLAVRKVNDQLMFLERAFIDDHGLPLWSQCRHVVFAPSMKDSYSSTDFAGLADLISEAEYYPEKKKQFEQEIQKHASVIVYHIESATQVLSGI